MEETKTIERMVKTTQQVVGKIPKLSAR